MYLSNDEEKILNGEQGEAAQKAMQLITALGDIYKADKLIPIKSVQVAGVSYKTIGDAGIDFIRFFKEKNAKVVVPTTLNPAGCDIENWKEIGFDENFVNKQKEIIDIFGSLGINTTCTCTPYYIGNRPGLGDHIAWAESSAVSFSNSVLGARTNREGGPSALAASIVGKTANYGYHLEENRKAKFVINVEADLKTKTDFGLLGVHVGKIVEKAVPAFKIQNSNVPEHYMKALGAAMAASGAVALYYIENTTPEFVLDDSPEQITVTNDDLQKAKDDLTTGESADLIAFGCPHCSLEEIKEIADIVKDKQINKKFWVCVARQIKKQADEQGYTETIEKAGGKMVCDTCPVVSPIEHMGYTTTATDSGKCAKYLPSFCKQKVIFGSAEELLK
ncbi:hypothetical protein CL614_01155 [archaeon]|nr:hypothetical protein [archaeon]